MRYLLALPMLLASPAMAEVTASAPDGFTSRHVATFAQPPAKLWSALMAWDRWWPAQHSYSGKAPRLRAIAGGDLREDWAGGSVVHATVLTVMPGKLLRLDGGFGPLQSLPVTAILSFDLKPVDGGTQLTMTYRVSGPQSAGLASMATPVDAVMGEGFAGLQRVAARR